MPNLKTIPWLLPVLAGVMVVGMGGLLVAQWSQVTDLTRQLEESHQAQAVLQGEKDELTAQVGQAREERTRLERRLASLQRDLSTVNDELMRNQEALTTQTAALEEAQASVQDLTDRVTRLTEERATLEGRVADLTSTLTALQTREARLAQEHDALTRVEARLRERLEGMERQYAEAMEGLESLEALLDVDEDELSCEVLAPLPARRASSPATPSDESAGAGAVELPPIVVRQEASSPMEFQPIPQHAARAVSSASVSVPRVRGRLLEINEMHQFIVMDQGSQHGVREGMTFDILRDATPVGRVTAVRVRPTLSACDIQPAHTSVPLRIGDTAVPHLDRAS